MKIKALKCCTSFEAKEKRLTILTLCLCHRHALSAADTAALGPDPDSFLAPYFLCVVFSPSWLIAHFHQWAEKKENWKMKNQGTLSNQILFKLIKIKIKLKSSPKNFTMFFLNHRSIWKENGRKNNWLPILWTFDYNKASLTGIY